MKAYARVGVQLHPFQLQQDIGWVASFMSWLIYTQEKEPVVPIEQEAGWA